MDDLFDEIIIFIRKHFPDFPGAYPLYRTYLRRSEAKYLSICTDTNNFSSGGSFIKEFEKKIAEYAGSEFRIAVVYSTAGFVWP